MPKKQQISYIKPEEPSFLKEIKKKVGYKEGPTIEDKKKYDHEDEESSDQERERSQREDKPQVVVLKEGDLNEVDLQKFLKQKEDEEDKKKIESGKITFTKPESSNKRHSVEDDGNVATTKKQKLADSETSKSVLVKATNQTRLLSFSCQDEDD